MPRIVKIAVTSAMVGLLVTAWGYWHSVHHAALSIRVHDHALATPRQTYDAPRDVALTFRGKAGIALATAHSIEPHGLILAVHPDAGIGTCRHRGGNSASSHSSRSGYAECFEQHSTWVASWAPLVHDADVLVGLCELRHVPVEARVTSTQWWLWWFPHPHIGGIPYRYVELTIAIDSRACTPVKG